MSQHNLALARKYFGELHTDKFATTADEIFDANLILQGPAVPTRSTRGREGYKTIMARYQSAFPDRKTTVEDWIVEGDKVVGRYTFEGTHTGPLPGIPPTGKHVKTTGVTILRIARGKIVEVWSFSDALGMLQQLGVIPSSLAGAGAVPLTSAQLATQQPTTSSAEPTRLSTDKLKAIATRLYEGLNKRELSIIDELFAPNYRFYRPASPVPLNREGFKQVRSAYVGTAFPDWHVTVDDLIAENDKVLTRVRMSGSHKGDFLGVPATGKRVEIEGLDIFRVAEGNIVEHWVQSDALGLLRQVGLLPEHAQPQRE